MQHTSAAAATLVKVPVYNTDWLCLHALLAFLCSSALLGVTWLRSLSLFARGHILQSSDSLVTESRFVRAVILVALAMSEVDVICLAQQASCCKFLKFFSKFLFAFSVSLCWMVLQHVPAFWLEIVKCNRGKLHKMHEIPHTALWQ